MTQRQTDAPSAVATTNAPRSASIAALAPAVVGSLLVLIAPLGLGWLFSPANPAAKLPALTLSFSDLHKLMGSGAVPTNSIQEAYFGWLAWTVIVVAIVLALATAVTRMRPLAIGLAVVALVGLVTTALGVKGPLTWGQFSDQIPHIRIGGYLIAIGYLVLLATAGAIARRRN